MPKPEATSTPLSLLQELAQRDDGIPTLLQSDDDGIERIRLIRAVQAHQKRHDAPDGSTCVNTPPPSEQY
ncbi:MAG TPA: hypothetical protein VF510_07560 [Ktedonobacterales bacterium]